jgi:hypothetical protein
MLPIRASSNDFMERNLVEQSLATLVCSLDELALRTQSPELLEQCMVPNTVVASLYKDLLGIARTKQSIAEGVVRSFCEQNFYNQFNDHFDRKILDTSLLISNLIRLRLFNSVEDDGQGKTKLFRLEEVDRMPVEYLILVELASVIPRIGLACLAPIGYLFCFYLADKFKNCRFILVESMQNITQYSRESRATIQNSNKQALLELVLERAGKHLPCCYLFADMTCMQIAFFSLVRENIEWAIKRIIATAASEDELLFAATANKDLIIACSSARLLEDHRLARLVLENQVNDSSELSKYYFLVLGQGTEILELISKDGTTVRELAVDHPFVAVKETFQLDHRIIVVAQSYLTINFFVGILEIGSRLFVDQGFLGLGTFGSGLGQGVYRKAIRDAAVDLCRELAHILGSMEEDDIEDDAPIIGAIEQVEWTLTRAIYWPTDALNFLRLFINVWMFWIQKHAKAYLEPKSSDHLLWSMTWAVRVCASLITYTNCPLIPMNVLTRRELCILRDTVYPAFISKDPPLRIREEHRMVVQGLRVLLFHHEKNVGDQDDVESCYGCPIVLGSKAVSRYRILAPLSIGEKAKVFKALDLKTRSIVAVKQTTASAGEDDVTRLLMTIDHINIVHHLECFRSDVFSYLVMEYCDGSNLRLWRKRRWTSEASVDSAEWRQRDLWIRRFGRQLLVGLSYLHTHHIVHRDIKPENIFLTASQKVKIGDFEEAIQVTTASSNIHCLEKPLLPPQQQKFDLYQLHGTISYMAPECLHNHTVTAKADIWSFGCVLSFLVTGRYPWAAFQDPMAILYQLGVIRGLPVDLDEMNCSPACKEIILMCLNYDPEKRPRAVDLLCMDYFSSV